MVKVKMYSIERDKTVIEDLTKEKVLTAYNKLCDTLDTLKCINTLLKECDKLDEKTKQQFKFLHLNRNDRDRLVQLDKHIGYFMLNSPFLPQIAKTLHNAKTDAVVVHPLSQDEKLEEEVLDMHVAYGLRTNPINPASIITSATLSTNKRNSVLEMLYKQSAKTRSNFVAEMQKIARNQKKAKTNLARVLEFEKYLKTVETLYAYSGFGYEGAKKVAVQGLVSAANEKEAYNKLETNSHKYQIGVQMHEADLTLKEIMYDEMVLRKVSA